MFYAWLICLRSFSVVKYRPGFLFCIWSSTAGNCTLPYLHVLLFAFYIHRLGSESMLRILFYLPFTIPSRRFGASAIVGLILLGDRALCFGNHQFGAVCKKNVIYLIEVNGLHELLVHNLHPAAILHNCIRGSTREGKEVCKLIFAYQLNT